MNRIIGSGVVFTVLGVVGYSIGVFVSYPGRAFSITAVMIGISLLAIGRRSQKEVQA